MRARGFRGVALLLIMVVAAATAAEPNIGQVPQRGHVRVGGFLRTATLDTFEYDNRDLTKDTELDYKGLQIQYGVTEALHVAVRQSSVSWLPNPKRSGHYDDGTAVGFSIGGTVAVYRDAGDGVELDIGWDFQYDKSRFDAITSWNGALFGGEAEWWRAGLALYGGYRIFHGFAGLRYSQVDLTYTHDSARGLRRGGFQEDDPWGGVIGGGIFWPSGFVLQAEIALGNTSGYELALMYDFSFPKGWL